MSLLQNKVFTISDVVYVSLCDTINDVLYVSYDHVA